MVNRPGMYTGEDISIDGVPFNSVDSSGCQWFIEDLDGWWGLPEPNVPDDRRAFADDGDYYAPGRFEARQITVKGRIVPPNGVGASRAVALARNALNRAMTLVRKVAVLYVNEAPEPAKVANVQLIGRPLTKFDSLSNVLEFNFQLKASDPRKYSAFVESGVPESTPLFSQSSGRTYDRTYLYGYGDSVGETGMMTVINSGSYDTYGTLRIVGPVVNPSIEHIEQGKTLAFTMRIGSNEYLDVNLRNRTVIFNDSGARRGSLVPNSQWFHIQPGVNTLRYLGTQTVGARPALPAATNLATNPSFETTTTGSIVYTNQATRPRPVIDLTNYTYNNATGEAGTTIQAGLTPAPTPVIARTNYAVNPVPATLLTNWTYTAGTGETGTSELVSIVDNPNAVGTLGFYRRNVTAAKTAGTSTLSYTQTVSGATGQIWTGSVYTRSTAGAQLNFTITFMNGATPVGTATTENIPVEQYTPAETEDPEAVVDEVGWTRLSVTGSATGAFTSIVLSATETLTVNEEGESSLIQPAGAQWDFSNVLLERSSALLGYFDGSTEGLLGSADKVYSHAWVGTADASNSTQRQSVPDAAVGPTNQLGYARRIITAAKTSGTASSFVYTQPSGMVFAAGNVLYASAYIRPSVSITVTPTIVIRQNTTTINTVVGTPVSVLGGEWTRITVSVAATAVTNNAILTLAWNDTVEAGEIVDMSNVTMTVGATPYFDGEFADVSLSGEYVWLGTANDSKSQFTRYAVRQFGTTSAIAGVNSAQVYQSSQWAANSPRSLAINAAAATSNDTYATPGGATASTAMTNMNMTPGGTYTVSGFVNTPDALTGTLHTNARRIVVDITTSGGPQPAFAVSEAPLNDTGVYRLSTTFTLPLNTTGVVLKLYNGSNTGVVYWDGVMIEPSDRMSDEYVDGDSPFASWAGAPHASTSSRANIEGIPESVIQLSYRSAWIE